MILKLIGGTLLTFAIVWALVLGWWQSNDHTPGITDLVLFLGALPLALVGGFLLLRGFIEHLKAPIGSPEKREAAFCDDDPLAAQTSRDDAAERAFRLPLAESFVLTGAGGADDVLAALSEGKLPQPSKRLLDAIGFPAYAVEIEGIDTGEIDNALSSTGGALAALVAQERNARALTLLDQVVAQARDRVDGLAEAGAIRRLSVLWLVPGDWPAECLDDMQTWCREACWRNTKIADLDISTVPVSGEDVVMQVLDEMSVTSCRSPSPDEAVLIVAATSWIDAAGIVRLDETGQLFSPNRQECRIPGEAAVALLFGHFAVQPDFASEGVVTCSRINAGLRDKPLEAKGRLSGKLLQKLLAGLFDASGTDGERIAAVVADTDLHASRIAELHEGVAATLEHLDPAKDYLTTGAVAGNSSPIAPLVALAVAKNKVIEQTAPVVCLSNQHPSYRAVWLLEPCIVKSSEKSD